jgi:CRP-like cAMP-binding protein
MKGIVQIPGTALAMRNGSFQKFLENPPFRTIMGAYVEKAMALLAQSAACLAFHPLEQRLARWLLEVRERVAMDDLQLTHEFLAQMLGVRRPSATLAVNAMVRAGLIEQARGRIRILNPNGLLEASCECYRTLRTYRDA